MKTMIISFVTLGAWFAASAGAEPRMGQPSYGGSGCPAGSAWAKLSEDGQFLSFELDSFEARVGKTRGFDRKTCALAIPVSVPEGYAVALPSASLQASLELSAKARATLSSEVFFGGSTGLRSQRSFEGPISRDVELNSAVTPSQTQWSACGRDVILRVQSSVLLRASNDGHDSAVFVASPFRRPLSLTYRRCK